MNHVTQGKSRENNKLVVCCVKRCKHDKVTKVLNMKYDSRRVSDEALLFMLDIL